MPAKKSSAKTTVKRKTTSRSATTHKRAGAKPSAKRATPQAKATTTKKKKNKAAAGTLHNVARSIGSTLGNLAKKTGRAVEAARNALPNPLHSGNNES